MRSRISLDNPALRLALYGLLGIYGLFVIYNVAFNDKQWDFRTYYHAAKALSIGEDPYDADKLSELADRKIDPYVYPPVTLWFFRPFTVFSYETSYYIYLCIKLIALLSLIAIWSRFFVTDRSWRMLLFLLIFLAFRQTVFRDLRAGNISCFEQLAFWAAAYCFIRRRYGTFAVLIMFASLFKISGVVFLLMPLIDKDRRSMLPSAYCLTILAAVGLTTYFAFLAHHQGFVANAGFISEAHNSAPSAFVFIRDGVKSLARYSDLNAAHLGLALYGLYVALLLSITYRMVRGIDFKSNRMEFVIICALLYAMILPRFKTYSYIIMIIPALHVIRYGISSTAGKVIAATLVLTSFHTYHPWLVSVGLMITEIRYLQKRRSMTIEN